MEEGRDGFAGIRDRAGLNQAGSSRDRPGRPRTGSSGPGRAQMSWAEPGRAEPGWAQHTGLSRAEPGRTESGLAGPSCAGPSPTEPGRAGPGRAVPNRVEPDRAGGPYLFTNNINMLQSYLMQNAKNMNGIKYDEKREIRSNDNN